MTSPTAIPQQAEVLRIIDQLERAHSGDAWHGPAIEEILDGVTTETALRRPIAGAHNIWELVLHIGSWMQAAADALGGAPMPEMPWELDFPAVTDTSEAAWKAAVDRLERAQQALVAAARSFSDTALSATVPGREYSFYRLLHGVVQHNLYHGGQMALLKKAGAPNA